MKKHMIRIGLIAASLTAAFVIPATPASADPCIRYQWESVCYEEGDGQVCYYNSWGEGWCTPRLGPEK